MITFFYLLCIVHCMVSLILPEISIQYSVLVFVYKLFSMCCRVFTGKILSCEVVTVFIFYKNFLQRHSLEEGSLSDDWQMTKMDEFFKVFAKEEIMESIDSMAPSLARIISLPLRLVMSTIQVLY